MTKTQLLIQAQRELIKRLKFLFEYHEIKITQDEYVKEFEKQIARLEKKILQEETIKE